MSVSQAAEAVATLLQSTGRRLVLAESCTGGLVAATLAQIPGISDVLCGSVVVYRAATKAVWLGVDQRMLEDPAIGPVSAEVTRELALAVLDQTPEADLSAAVTGHLGPHAPTALDGVVHVAIAIRYPRLAIVAQVREVLTAAGPDPVASRVTRQQRATELVLDTIAATLRG